LQMVNCARLVLFHFVFWHLGQIGAFKNFISLHLQQS
jgi:hypothetical protein